MRAAGGAYKLPAFGGGSGESSTPLSIDSIIQNVGAYSPTANGGGSLAPLTSSNGTYNTVNGPKTQEQMASELKTAGWGGNTADAAAVSAAYGSTSKGAVTPMSTSSTVTPNSVSNPLTNPTEANGMIPAYGGLPKTGNQLAPSFVNNADPGQKDLLGAAYQDQGINWNDIMAQYNKSLGAYGGPRAGGVGF